MKRLLLMFCILSFLFLFSITSYAADITNRFNVEVKTKYVEKDVVVGEEEKKSGDLVAEMDDGIVITAKGTFLEETQLMVKNIQKNKNSEWDWIQGITSTVGKNKYVYYIFLVDEEGKIIENVRGCEISILLDSLSKNMQVYYISGEGEKKRLEAYIEGNIIRFNMIKNGFYTLVFENKKDINVKEDNSGEDEEDADKNDKDENNKDENNKEEQKDTIKDKDNTDTDIDEQDDKDNEDSDEIDDDKDEGIVEKDSIYKDLTKGGNIRKNQDIKENVVWIFIVIISITIVILGIRFIILLRDKKKEDEDL